MEEKVTHLPDELPNPDPPNPPLDENRENKNMSRSRMLYEKGI